jgi:Raf kinase inhibitor-like YbhB/YbcL family protein
MTFLNHAVLKNQFRGSDKRLQLFLFLMTAALLFSCHSSGFAQTGEPMSFQISSTSFPANEMIPKKFTCAGQDVSPQLSWKGAPSGTKTFALIMDDPDAPAGTWVHWVLYNLPANIQELPEDVEKQEQLSNGALQGRNDFRKTGYGGPCPPAGKPHRYFFKLYALDANLDLKAGASKADVERAMQNHTLGHAELVGRFGR